MRADGKAGSQILFYAVPGRYFEHSRWMSRKITEIQPWGAAYLAAGDRRIPVYYELADHWNCEAL